MSIEAIKQGGMGAMRVVVDTLNQPVVKETVKKVMGCAYAAFGTVAALCIILDVKKGYYFSPKTTFCQKLTNTAWGVSLIGLALTTPPGAQFAGWAMTSLFGQKALVSAFGPNVNFATNPWHPRHVVSIGSFAIGTALIVTALFQRRRPVTHGKASKSSGPLKVYVALIALSRPSLHICNLLARRILQFAT